MNLGTAAALRSSPRRRSSAGQSVVELALILPVLFLLIAGAADLGRIFFSYVSLANAAKEGAFYGAINPRCDATKTGCPGATVTSKVLADMSGLVPSSLAIDCLDSSGTTKSVNNCQTGETYRVVVSYRLGFLMPVLQAILGPSMTVTGRAQATVLSTAFDPNATPPPGCAPNLAVPNLTGGITVTIARKAWSDAGFTGVFNPASGFDNTTVLSQTVPAGTCAPKITPISVTHT